MSDDFDFRKEALRALITSVMTALFAIAGYWIGQGFEKCEVAEQKLENHQNIIKAIKVETIINDSILTQSFNNTNIDTGYILRDCEFNTVQSFLANQEFVTETRPEDISLLSDYLAMVKRLNGFRNFKNESFIYPSIKALYTKCQMDTFIRYRNNCLSFTQKVLQIDSSIWKKE